MAGLLAGAALSALPYLAKSVASGVGRYAPIISRGIGTVADTGRAIGEIINQGRFIGGSLNRAMGGKLTSSPLGQKIDAITQRMGNISTGVADEAAAFRPAFDTATNQLQQLPNARLVFGQQRGYSARPMKRRIKSRLAKQ